MDQVIPVILSGGSGTRLWPLSRKHYPKQFHKLSGGQYSLLQETVLRISHLAPPIIVCNEDHRFMMAEQIHSIGITPAAILLEPASKNTAPAITLAALKAIDINPDAIIAIFPADHTISELDAFNAALECAEQVASTSNDFITFGIVPTFPESGYGYIEFERSTTADKPVKRFIEKPDLSTAQKYLESGQYLWNSGMFMFRATAYINALETLQPEILATCRLAYEKSQKDLDFIRIDSEAFNSCPSDSIDYAVMEKSKKVRVVPMNAGWNDIGSWRATWEILEKDKNQTAVVGDVLKINTRNTLLFNDSKDKLIVAIGVDNLIIVDTPNALLVAHKDQVQSVKQVVETIADSGRSEHLFHREVHRPWGSYDSIDCGERYQVKRITVKPGASLSLQMHHHRSEHWIVVSGTASVQVGEAKSILTENQSIYIPLGALHRLTNPGKLPLELIEVQSGSYLGEDDIVRFEDTFGRA